MSPCATSAPSLSGKAQDSRWDLAVTRVQLQQECVSPSAWILVTISVSSTAPPAIFYTVFSSFLISDLLRELCCVAAAQHFCPWVPLALICCGREVHKWWVAQVVMFTVSQGGRNQNFTQQNSQSRSACWFCFCVTSALSLTRTLHVSLNKHLSSVNRGNGWEEFFSPLRWSSLQFCQSGSCWHPHKAISFLIYWFGECWVPQQALNSHFQWWLLLTIPWSCLGRAV